jgi:hypothetical protein
MSSVGLVVLAEGDHPFANPFVRLGASLFSKDTAATAVMAVVYA